MLIPAADYLTYAEAVALYNDLREQDIIALVKSAGPPTFPYGEGMYYQLWIEETEAEAARETVEAFEAERISLRVLRCPKCKAPDPVPSPSPAWWKRLFYAGTVLHKCPNCNAEFPV
ncbi:hypothetical protein J0X19_12115 [Hymenobacter sp. BT186]|uniref:DUF2007 domain-containing protein n=1 Tax=Hymenobacter telluris TaxID=2816474 RepID=A0A939EVP3_9BACT|nr:hypothetical protein [Hymenobacter telluris]MBO0358694.1 hypothetical protein [Hymenobacter telluris]MBW3374720.1 hypothetical protein [Hymenobacter norwichensis]